MSSLIINPSASGIGNIQNINDATNGAGSASLSLLANGTYDVVNGVDGNWLSPVIYASKWEVFATILSGSLTSGTTGSWIDISTTRTWTKGAVGVCVLQLQFRDKATLVVLNTQSVNIERS